MTADKQLLTHSRMAAFKSCRKKHWFAYELSLRPLEDAKALRMGSAFHAGIEALSLSAQHTLLTPAECKCDNSGHCNICDGGLAYCKVCRGGESELEQPCNLRLACDAIRNVYRNCPEQFDAYWWSIECETILRLVCGYQWRWADAALEVLATEQSFRLALINPATGAESKIFDLAGKIDGIVRLEDGRPAVKETKTTGDDLGPDSELWRRLRIDHQISNYIAAARRLGFPVDTVLYDVCRKPSIQPTPVPLVAPDGWKIVLDQNGNRVRTKDGKKWRETSDKEAGYTLQTRPMTVEEWGAKLSADIAERPDFYFVRREVPRLDQDVAEYQDELWMIQQTLREAQRNGKWYRTVGRDTCPFCPYFEPCTNGFDASSGEVPDGFQYVTDPNPELEGKCNVNRTDSSAAPTGDDETTSDGASAAASAAPAIAGSER